MRRFQVKQDVDAQVIADNIVSVVEGHYSPWLKSLENMNPRGKTGHELYSEGTVYDEYLDFVAVFDREKDSEGTFKGRKTITFKAVQKGLDVMAKNYPTRFAELTSREGDAITADIFLQCVIFGRLIYG